MLYWGRFAGYHTTHAGLPPAETGRWATKPFYRAAYRAARRWGRLPAAHRDPASRPPGLVGRAAVFDGAPVHRPPRQQMPAGGA